MRRERNKIVIPINKFKRDGKPKGYTSTVLLKIDDLTMLAVLGRLVLGDDELLNSSHSKWIGKMLRVALRALYYWLQQEGVITRDLEADTISMLEFELRR